jgi:hypothetical protein
MGAGMVSATPAEQSGFADKIKSIVNGLIEVKVVTVVADATVTIADDDGRTKVTVAHPRAKADALVTTINLIDGDVVNVISPALQDDVALRDFHAAQVAMAGQVLPDNVDALLGFATRVFGLPSGEAGG